MPDNFQVQNSDQSIESVEDSLERLKIHEDEESQGMAQPSPYPDRPGEPDCLYFLRTGSCGYGSNCRFNHPASAVRGVLNHRDELPERMGQPNCEYFLKTGTCKYGTACKYNHPKDRNGTLPVSFNILGLPMRQDQKPCSFYMRTGSCKFGNTCKFHHPQPASSVPLNGPSVLPSSGLPYIGGFPAWSVPRLSYMNGPSLEGPYGYMPVMVSPSQGILSAPGLNSFLSSSLADMVGSRNQLDTVQNLPVRPDQPECRYYMNSGACKYGAECKYDHPKERMAQIPSSTINSLALPTRPGQTICASYITHGVCKFGSACRFDHPLMQYPLSYGLSLHDSSMLDSSYQTYPRLSPTANAFDTSQLLPSRGPERTKNPKPGGGNNSLEPKKSIGTSEQVRSDSLPQISAVPTDD